MKTGDLYDAITDDAAYAALPHNIAAIVGGRSAFVQEFAGGKLVGVSYSYCSEDLVADIVDGHQNGVDIWAEAGLRHLAANRTGLLDRWVPTDTFRQSRLRRIMLSHGDDTGHSMGILHTIDGALLGVSVQRPLGHPLTERDAAALDALAPDVNRILRVRRLLRDHDRATGRLNHLLAAGRTRAMLVEANLTVVEASPDAQAILDARDGLTLYAGQLVPADPRVAAALRQAVHRCVHRRGVRQSTFVCARPSGEPAWRLLVLPLPDTLGPGCLIVVTGGTAPTDRLEMWLGDAYGATRAEIDVAKALYAGATPRAIADDRAVSVNTVRVQIRRLLERTGVRSISHLIGLMAELV